MDCREFREKHYAFVDDTLSGIELVGMQQHLLGCESCAKCDATIRRSLLVVRNLPRIEPSPEFGWRLEVRLREAKLAGDEAGYRSGRFRAGVAIASLAMLAYIGLSLRQVDAVQEVRFPPVVVAAAAGLEADPISAEAPAFVASMPAGLPLWTAALYTDVAPAHFASMQLRLVSSLEP